MELRPAEGTAASCLALPKHSCNLGKLILENFTQQEDRSLEQLELLQQDQKGQSDRFFSFYSRVGIGCSGNLCREDRLGQPSPHANFSLPERELELIHAQPDSASIECEERVNGLASLR
jgi:hypothetical protein